MNLGKGYPGSGIFAKFQTAGISLEGLLYFKDDPVPYVNGRHWCIDVKTTMGETVTDCYSMYPYENDKFNPKHLRGEYYLLAKDADRR